MEMSAHDKAMLNIQKVVLGFYENVKEVTLKINIDGVTVTTKAEVSAE